MILLGLTDGHNGARKDGSMRRPTNVVIVREGHWGLIKEGGNDSWVMACQWNLEEATTLDTHTHAEVPAAKVEIIEKLEQLEPRLKFGDVDVVIFVSKGVAAKAKQLKAKYPRTRMFVCTGDVPDDEIIWVRKSSLDGEMMKKLFLS